MNAPGAPARPTSRVRGPALLLYSRLTVVAESAVNADDVSAVSLRCHSTQAAAMQYYILRALRCRACTCVSKSAVSSTYIYTVVIQYILACPCPEPCPLAVALTDCRVRRPAARARSLGADGGGGVAPSAARVIHVCVISAVYITISYHTHSQCHRRRRPLRRPIDGAARSARVPPARACAPSARPPHRRRRWRRDRMRS